MSGFVFRSLAIGAVAAMAGFAGVGAGAQTLDQLYEAAKKEGVVSVATAPAVEVRNELTKAFSARFPDIKLEVSGMAPQQLVTKLRSEARANIQSTDVIIGGTSAAFDTLKPAGMLDKIDHWLVTADAKDQSKWRGGAFAWADADHMAIALAGQLVPVAVINTDLVKPGEMTSALDLLDPKWKGRIISFSPLVPGPASVVYQIWYDQFGEDFLRKLVAQEIVLTRDLRQAVDFVAKGQYAVSIGSANSVAIALIEKGAKNIKPMGARDWKDPLALSSGFGALFIPVKVPHPNAAKLFVNWLMSKDGQLALSVGNGSASLRTDVPADHVNPSILVFDDSKYVVSYDEKFMTAPSRTKMRDVLISLGWK